MQREGNVEYRKALSSREGFQQIRSWYDEFSRKDNTFATVSTPQEEVV